MSTPVAFADAVAFESAMSAGKGCDVWPSAGDYEERTGRKLLALFLSPPSQDEPKFSPAGWLNQLVHISSGQVIRVMFDAEAPLEGPDAVHGFEWRSTQLFIKE